MLPPLIPVVIDGLVNALTPEAQVSAIQRDLGFAPTTPIDVGIPIWVDWYRAYRHRSV